MYKPIPKAIYAYDWNELVEWVRHKTGRSVNDWAGMYTRGADDDNTPYQNLWFWICETRDVHNGGIFELSLHDADMPDTESEDAFVREILAILREDFGDETDTITCRASW